MKKLPNPSEMLVEAFREFNANLETLSNVLEMLAESKTNLNENLNKYQEELDKTIFNQYANKSK
jgi:two-component sensor histidine kinase